MEPDPQPILDELKRLRILIAEDDDVTAKILEVMAENLGYKTLVTTNGALDLANKLANNDTVRSCIATQWYRYAMGRIEDQNDACSLNDVKARFSSNSGNFRELLVAITLSDAFRYRPALESP